MDRRRYGISFQGSKSAHATEILSLIPSAAHFYDLFAGGCSMAHAAAVSGKFGHVHANDISDSALLFRRIIDGDIPDPYGWVERDDFIATKKTDALRRIQWSFGGNQRSYLYSIALIPYRKALHEAVVNRNIGPISGYGFDMTPILYIDDVPGRRKAAVRVIESRIPDGMVYKSYSHLYYSREAMENPEAFGISPDVNIRPVKDLGSLDHIRKGECIAELAGLRLDAELTVSCMDYRDVAIEGDAVIYCDPPYCGCTTYLGQKFDHEAFYRWAHECGHDVYVSEYWMPDDMFECIYEFERVSTMSAFDNRLVRTEKIYIPRRNHVR